MLFFLFFVSFIICFRFTFFCVWHFLSENWKSRTFNHKKQSNVFREQIFLVHKSWDGCIRNVIACEIRSLFRVYPPTNRMRNVSSKCKPVAKFIPSSVIYCCVSSPPTLKLFIRSFLLRSQMGHVFDKSAGSFLESLDLTATRFA